MLVTLELQFEGFHGHTSFSDLAYISTLWIQVGLEKVREKSKISTPQSYFLRRYNWIHGA